MSRQLAVFYPVDVGVGVLVHMEVKLHVQFVHMHVRVHLYAAGTKPKTTKF